MMFRRMTLKEEKKIHTESMEDEENAADLEAVAP